MYFFHFYFILIKNFLKANSVYSDQMPFAKVCKNGMLGINELTDLLTLLISIENQMFSD